MKNKTKYFHYSVGEYCRFGGGGMKPTNINLENILAPYRARKLTEADIPDILDLYSENMEYFMHCPPSPTRETVKEDLVALPPKKEATDKYFIGIFDDNCRV